ncbi:MAG: hypothetical protein DHS20C14_15930 [Phycisphaeraceae bacterium]|nr:MAG: hypothetical protein DHS20C14_15930 [Phycisphaeraceae bacterium]
MPRRWTDRHAEPRTPNCDPGTRLLSHGQLVERILELNPTARTSFLRRFDAGELRSYLDHLTVAAQPRGEASRWVRPGDTRAIVASGEED